MGSMSILPETLLLDSGPEQTVNLAAHIPVGELPGRTQELPPRGQVIKVADTGPEAREAVNWLESHGRRAILNTKFDTGLYKARLWKPTGFLRDSERGLPKGAALDLACGTGRDV